MERNESTQGLTWLGRFKLAMRLLFSGEFADQVTAGLSALAAKRVEVAAPKAPPPERLHASGLLLLNSLQREGRLVDFLEQDVSGFSDEDVGAAARVVHTGCRKIVKQYFELEPATNHSEGAPIIIPQGFDSQRFRLTGNVVGNPPYKGTLKHHGWIAKETRMPALSEAIDPRVVAAAEVELS
jgi:hypothetical protein